MNGISSYGAYLGSQYDSHVQNRNKSAATAGKTQDVKAKGVQLSDKAKDLLKELRQAYGNVDFMVADYNTDEEADSILSKGTKEFSVLIDPEELEKMANDEDVKKKNLGIIDEAMGKIKDIKEQLGDKTDEVVHIGVSIDKNGTVSYFADLETLSDRQKERIEESKEEKAEEKKESAKEEGRYIHGRRVKKTRVSASSAEGLLDEINNVDWAGIKEERPAAPEYQGSRFSYSI